MNDLETIAEGVIREYLLRVVKDEINSDLMEDDPDCRLLPDEDYNKVAAMIEEATINIRVVIH